MRFGSVVFSIRNSIMSIYACFLSPLATSHRPRASDQFTLRFSWPLPVATTVVANSGPPMALMPSTAERMAF
jgi:hypothetical protein